MLKLCNFSSSSPTLCLSDDHFTDWTNWEMFPTGVFFKLTHSLYCLLARIPVLLDLKCFQLKKGFKEFVNWGSTAVR